MRFSELIPDAEVLCALEPDELGLRMLALLAEWHGGNRHAPAVQLMDMLSDDQLGPYPGDRKEDVKLAIREAWALLEGAALLIDHPGYRGGQMKMLSRRAKRLGRETDIRRAFSARLIPKESLHESIREDVWSLYHRGKYDTAVFEAMKAVEVAVREAAGLTTTDIGKDLMRTAFNVDNGPLTDMTAEKAERQARSDLFAGAIASYKNPHSHRRVDLDDPDEAAEIIMIANHLLRIVDTRRTATKTSLRESS